MLQRSLYMSRRRLLSEVLHEVFSRNQVTLNVGGNDQVCTDNYAVPDGHPVKTLRSPFDQDVIRENCNSPRLGCAGWQTGLLGFLAVLCTVLLWPESRTPRAA
jgi:hypothetical protein